MTAAAARTADLGEEEASILAQLPTATYQELSEANPGWSRGRIYALALRNGARKTEARIAERAAERRERRRETLEAILESTQTSDVLDFLDGLPDGSARMVLSSPPYNIGKKYGGAVGADAMAYAYYVGWMMQVLSECARIIADGGVLFLQVGSTRDGAGVPIPLDVALFDAVRQTGMTFQSRIVWTVGHGLTPRRRLSERHETVLVFSKGPPATFNPTPGRTPQKQPGKRAYKGSAKGSLSGHPAGAWPSNVWAIPNVGHGSPEKTGHPAQMPAELARRAMLIYSMPGDLVVDPFSGSGTTHEACIATGRSFVGADLSYDGLRAQRLAGVTPNAVTSLPGVSDASVAVWQAEARRIDRPCRTPMRDAD